MTSTRKGVLLGLTAYAAFSFSDAFIKLLKGSVLLLQRVFLGVLLFGSRWPATRMAKS